MLSSLTNEDFEIWLAQLEAGMYVAIFMINDERLTSCWLGDHTEQSPNFCECASLVRVSDALVSPRMLAFARRTLKQLWPLDHNLDALRKIDGADAFGAVVLARAHDIPFLLKPAFYRILRCVEPIKATFELRRRSPLLSLSDDDVCLLTSACGHIRAHWVKTCLLPPDFLSAPCPSSQELTLADSSKTCNSLRTSPNQTRWQDFMVTATDGNYIDDYHSFARLDWTALDFCQLCNEQIRAHWAQKTVEFWEKVDEWLELHNTASVDGVGSAT